MRFTYFFVLLLVLGSCQKPTPGTSPIRVEVSPDIPTPRHYIVGKTNTPIQIDGKAREAIWQQTSFSEPFIDIEGEKTPQYETRMKMLWDDDFLYVFAQLKEPHIWGNLRQRDTVIFYNNDFEVFIDPSGDTYNYGEIEINALGTVWDLLLDKPYRVGGKANNHWNLDSLKTAIHIEGTLNDPSDIDSFWTVEMAIPMQALIEIKDSPKVLPKDGELWRINFSRVNWDHDLINGNYRRQQVNGKYSPEYNWVWSNQKVINMHEPEKWGYLQFSDQALTDQVPKKADPFALSKQITYALFRKIRFGTLKHFNKLKTGQTAWMRVYYAANQSVDAIFTKTHFGFEIETEIPGNSQHKAIINEEGIFKVF